MTYDIRNTCNNFPNPFGVNISLWIYNQTTFVGANIINTHNDCLDVITGQYCVIFNKIFLFSVLRKICPKKSLKYF